MQRKGNPKRYGLDDLLRTEASRHASSYNIDLDFCIDDIAENYIYQEEEYQQIPIKEIKEILFEGINDLIDDFAENPNKYLNHELSQRLIKLAAEHQESIDCDKYNYYATGYMPHF